jgi:2-methylisocitrate lyase-like PEP mutase family enzyme
MRTSSNGFATEPEAVARHVAMAVATGVALLRDPRAVSAAIDRLVALADAGADCLYAPGVTNKDDIAAMVRAVAPKPVNVLVLKPGMTLDEFRDLGVRRVSVGGALARVAWGAMLAAAQSMKIGSFAGLATAAAGTTLNETFQPPP